MRAAPGAVRELGKRRRAPVVDHADRHAEPRLENLPEPHVANRRVHGAEARPRSACRRGPERRTPPRRRSRRAAPTTVSTSASSSSSCESRGVGCSRTSRTCPESSSTPARIFVPPRSTPITLPPLTRRVPYSDGWRRRTSPIASTAVVASRARCRRCPERRGPRRPTGAAAGARPARVRTSRFRRPSWKLIVLIVTLTVLLLAIAWGVIGLPLLPERRLGREQALRPRARREGAARDEQRVPAQPRHDDPAARHGQRPPRPAGAATATPTRSCSCAPTRRTTSSRTSRSRATCSCRCPASATRRSTRRTRRAARRSRSRRCTTSRASRSTTP